MKNIFLKSALAAIVLTIIETVLRTICSVSVSGIMAAILFFVVAFMCFFCLLLKDGKNCVPVTESKAENNDVSKADRSYALYQRALDLMEKERPFLDEGLDLDKFSQDVFSNKVYVSKTINLYSGMNFRQFINTYRVNYAVEQMKKNPHLRMEEVSSMSGFHSPVSFNMAFKLNFGKTPTEWLEEYVDSLRKNS